MFFQRQMVTRQKEIPMDDPIPALASLRAYLIDRTVVTFPSFHHVDLIVPI